MEKNEINSLEDLFAVLDRINGSIDWDAFYSERRMPAPFLVNGTLPDKAVTEFFRTHPVKTALEFGCGEGRNAVWLARRGVEVTAVDSSEVAIDNAGKHGEGLQNLRLICSDSLSFDPEGRRFDLVVDSGMFHHLAPHRRLQYRELLKRVLKEDGYFLLLCFSADAGGADELDDLEFYTKRNTGVSFSEQRIRRFFGEDFDILSVKPCGQEKTDEYMDIPFLYACIIKPKQKDCPVVG